MVALGVATVNVPVVVSVPKCNTLDSVVLIIPELIVKVPLTDKGTFNVTPVALELFT